MDLQKLNHESEKLWLNLVLSVLDTSQFVKINGCMIRNNYDHGDIEVFVSNLKHNS